MQEPQTLYRVKFNDPQDKTPVEVVCRYVGPSDFLGLVTLQDFVFNDQRKHVILPAEDLARKRFAKTKRLHIPYHHIINVEEFDDEPADLHNLPFVRPVQLVPESGKPKHEH